MLPRVARALLLLAAAGLNTAAAEVHWLAHEPGAGIPKDAIVAANEEGKEMYVCRAQLQDGVHPGATHGGPCLVPNRGKVEKASNYELAVGRDYWWSTGNWENAVVAGLQRQAIELYPCRAVVDSPGGRKAVEAGKAYRAGFHAGHCYVGDGDHELDVTSGFEVLHSSTGAKASEPRKLKLTRSRITP